MKKISKYPTHIGFIIDGNRRWARARGLPTYYGYNKGHEKVKEVLEWCYDKNILVVTCYVFSTENWNRSKREVSYLMKLIAQVVKDDVKELDQKGVQIRVSGDLDDPRIPQNVRNAIVYAQEQTKHHKHKIFNLAFNYGGRAEIVHAVKTIVKKGIPFENINEKTIEQNLWTAGLPDPDLIVRTSENRLSGFLLYQGAYAELYFIDKYWPDFSKSDFDKILKTYVRTRRRFGR